VSNLAALDRSVVALLSIGFLSAVGNALIETVLQPYLKHAGLSPWEVGTLSMAMSATAAVALVPSAYLADAHGRRKTALLALLPAAPGVLLVALAEGWVQLLLGFALLGLGNALFAVSLDPLLADVTPPELLDFVGSASQVLALAGSLLGLSLAWLPQVLSGRLGGLLAAYRASLLAGGAVSLASLLLLLPVRERRRAAGGIKLTVSREALLLTGLSAVLALGAGASVRMINYYFSVKFGVEAGELGARTMAERLLTIPATSAAPLLSARLGTLNALVLLQLLSIPFLVLTAAAPSFAAAAAAFTVRSALMQAGNPLFWALAMRIVREEERSRYSMLNALAWSAAGGVGSAVGGWLMGLCIDYPLYFTAALYSAELLLLYGLLRRLAPRSGAAQR